WIFTAINQLLGGDDGDYALTLIQRYKIIKKHWSMEADLCGHHAATRNFRKHLLWYTKGLEGSSRFRNLVSTLPDKESMDAQLLEYFQFLSSMAF
ncbi:MAG: tRNA-dihydrouridine synthase, partial [Smithella sp.]